MKFLKKIIVPLALATTLTVLPFASFASENTEEDSRIYSTEITAEITKTTAENTTENKTEVTAESDESEVKNITESEAENTAESKAENATESEASEGKITVENASESTAESEELKKENSSKNASESDTKNMRDEGTETADNAKSENGFEDFYALCMEHLSEILSLGALVASLICAAAYKSGLVPMLRQGLSAIGSTAQKIRESAEIGETKRTSDFDELKSALKKYEEKIKALSENLDTLSEKLECKETAEKREKRMEALMAGEIEMLYDIFMSSALPEYEKVRVGERCAKMKEVINDYESD